MAWAFVHLTDTTPTVSGNSFSHTLATTTTGNTLTCCIGAGAAVTVSSITVSTGSATFSKVIAKANGVLPLEIWQAPNITGGTTPTLTVNFSGAPINDSLFTYEHSGGPSSTILDGTPIASTGSSASPDSGAVTLANSNSLLIGNAQVAGTMSVVGTPSGSGSDDIDPNGNGASYRIGPAAGSYHLTGTQSPTDPWTAAIAGFALSGSTVNLGSVTMQGALGIRNSPVVVGKMPSVTMQASLGIRNSPVVVGKMPSVTMQALLGINAATLVGKMPSVVMKALLGITSATIGKLLISAGQMTGFLGIKPAPALSAGQQPTTAEVFTDGTGVHRVASINPQTGD